MKSKLVDWFLYDKGLRHERVNVTNTQKQQEYKSGLILRQLNLATAYK